MQGKMIVKRVSQKRLDRILDYLYEYACRIESLPGKDIDFLVLRNTRNTYSVIKDHQGIPIFYSFGNTMVLGE